MDRRGFQNNPPVQVGDELEVTIEAVGDKGDGVAKKDGFVLFVPGGKQGQNVKIKVNRVLKSVGFAEIIGEGSAPAEAEEEASVEEETPQEEAMPEEPAEDQPEDTEDFGEEEEPQEEVTAEETTAEESSEEGDSETEQESEEKKQE